MRIIEINEVLTYLDQRSSGDVEKQESNLYYSAVFSNPISADNCVLSRTPIFSQSRSSEEEVLGREKPTPNTSFPSYSLFDKQTIIIYPKERIMKGYGKAKHWKTKCD